MDYSRLDPVRRSTTPLQLDVVEAFVQNRLSRREFIQRATVVGLSMTAIGAVIAACGGGATPSPTAAGPSLLPSASSAGVAGGTIRVACQRPKTLDPVLMVDLAAYGIAAQCFEFLCTLNTAATDIAPGLAEKWSPNSDNSVWTFNLRRASPGTTASRSRRPMSSRRWSASSRRATPA